MKKEKMSERLSELQMCDLVKIYKEYDCLWDFTNDNYKNREMRDNAYKEICERMNIPGLKVSDIPQKIKNLRTSYYSELRKIESSIKYGGKVYKPRVAWFSIADEILRNVSKCTLAWGPNVETESEQETTTPITITNEDETPKTIASLDKIAGKVTPQIKPRPRTEPQTKQKEDEFDVYGQYIAVSLRSMPREMSIIARMELQKTMADIQLRVLRQRQRVENPERSGPSTSKMDKDPLDDPLDENEDMEQEFTYTTVKIEEDSD